MWVQILAFIFGIIIIVATVIIVIKTRKKLSKLDVTPNLPFVENPSRQEFTEGYYSGILKAQTPCKNGCDRIEYIPIDIEQGENKERPNVQCVIVKKEFIKRFSRGELSSRREIVKLIGRLPTDIPERLRETEEGKWLVKEGQKAWIISTFKEGIIAGDEAIAEAMTAYARGEITKATLAQLKETAKKQREIQGKTIETPEEKK